MSTDEKYNGWANRETWAVALHINNDQGWQESVREAVRNAVDGFKQDPPIWAVYDNEAEELRDLATAAGDAIRENVTEWIEYMSDRDTPEAAGDLYGILSDIGSLWRVDWTELGAAFLADLDEAGE